MAGHRIGELTADDERRLGPYVLLGTVSTGGMGRVYLGRHEDTGAPAAVKTLLAEGTVRNTDRRRFAREAELAERVRSPYTVRVLGHDAGAAVPWLAMDYVPAPSLHELVRRAGNARGSAVRWIAACVAEALTALHAEGIVHRDVKPMNVLLPADGPRLIDFGISHADDQTRTQLTLGTVAFTSPEQARREESTPASDLWSLGVTLFHLATGRLPYPDAPDSDPLIELVQRAELDLHGLPRELDSLVRGCLRPEPRDRPTPEEIRERFHGKLSAGSSYLPEKWRTHIAGFAAAGEAFTRSRLGTTGSEDPTVDQRTRRVPPPPPTRVDTEERRRAKRERADQERARKEREKAKERAREREKAKEKAREKERQRDREREKEGQESERNQAAAQTKESAQTVLGVVLVIALIGFLLWKFGDSNDGDPTSTDSTPTATSTYDSGVSAGSSGADDGLTSSGGSGSDYDSGDDTGADDEPTSEEPSPTPTPDDEDEAFAAVGTGDCLSNYQDGYADGFEWNSEEPDVVGCSSGNAWVTVTDVVDFGDECSGDTDTSRARWSHSGVTDEYSTTLCLERRFSTGQCFLAKGADNPDSSFLMASWDCDAQKIPAAYDWIMRITAYYRSEYDTNDCPGAQTKKIWSTDVLDGSAMVCMEVA